MAANRDALARAFDAQHRASLVGFDWHEPGGALEKVREETEEVAALIGGRGRGGMGSGTAEPTETTESREGGRADRGAAAGRRSELAGELGDLLFAAVNLARLAGVDPVAALGRATDKFEARFAEVRRLAAERGLPMPGTPLKPLDRLWDEVKRREADRRSS